MMKKIVGNVEGSKRLSQYRFHNYTKDLQNPENFA